MKSKILPLGNSLKNNLIKFLREIIAIPSFSGKEEAVIQRMKQEMQKLGYDKVWVDSFGNLIGQIGSGKRIIAFDGHCDTVGIGNEETWKVDPFKGDIKNDIIYGRGASDQKGGLAAAIYAGKIIKEIGLQEDISVIVTASVLEEDYEGLCWKYIIEEDKIVPELIVLTEPTDGEIKIGQRGRMEMKVRTSGISCHGSAPERGENAIYKMAPIIVEIENLNNRLYSESVLGKGTVTITDIQSAAPSLCAVADSAIIHLDRRITEGETLDICLQEITNLKSFREAQAEIYVPELNVKSYTGSSYPVKAYYPYWLIDENHPQVKKAKSAYEIFFQEKPNVGVWTFSTNGVVTNGVYNIPTIGFGPGSEKYAHTPQDQIHIDDLLQSIYFYTNLIIHF